MKRLDFIASLAALPFVRALIKPRTKIVARWEGGRVPIGTVQSGDLVSVTYQCKNDCSCTPVTVRKSRGGMVIFEETGFLDINGNPCKYI